MHSGAFRHTHVPHTSARLPAPSYLESLDSILCVLNTLYGLRSLLQVYGFFKLRREKPKTCENPLNSKMPSVAVERNSLNTTG